MGQAVVNAASRTPGIFWPSRFVLSRCDAGSLRPVPYREACSVCALYETGGVSLRAAFRPSLLTGCLRA